MTNAFFHNFTDQPFTGHWDGKPKTFKPGEKVYMPAYLAEHFATHLTNKVLIETGKETYTSPKRPGDVPQFMEIFNKAFIPDEESEGGNSLDDEIASVQKEKPGPSVSVEIEETKPINTGPAAAQAEAKEDQKNEELPKTPTGNETGPGSAPQVITPPEGDDDDEGFDHGTEAQK